jgi:hypothetical protein
MCAMNAEQVTSELRKHRFKLLFPNSRETMSLLVVASIRNNRAFKMHQAHFQTARLIVAQEA